MTAEILIVDDNADIRNILNDLIVDAGYSTRVAANYNQALNEIDKKIPEANAADVKHLNGYYLVPGLIDLHTHVYWGGTPLGVNAEAFYRRCGVTTFVDAGSAGAGNFEGFYEHVMKLTSLNILAYFYIL